MFKVLTNLEAMSQKACQNGVTKKQVTHLAELLTQYQAMFSQNDQDKRKNDLVQYSIPDQEGLDSSDNLPII